jgi:phosphatidate cytidylyltransferase
MASRGRRAPASTRRARRRGKRNAGSDLGARVLVAIPAILFAIFIVAQGGIVFAVGVGALGMICLHELFELLGGANPSRLAGFVGVAGVILAANYGSQFQVLLVMAAVVPVLFGLVILQPRAGTLSIAVTLLGVYWIGLALAHAVLLRKLPHGDGIVVDVLVGTFLGDTGAYLGGRLFGTAPLAPRISPSKTWEGLGIGVLTAVVAVWFAGLYQDWLTGANALLLGVGVAIAAPIGDLFESYIKRDAGTKDTGRFFGVHGGALDRLDAVIFTVVVGYYLWAAML